MPDEMDEQTVKEIQSTRMFDQAQSGLRDMARLLALHKTELVAAGFSEDEALGMTWELHAACVEKVMRQNG